MMNEVALLSELCDTLRDRLVHGEGNVAGNPIYVYLSCEPKTYRRPRRLAYLHHANELLRRIGIVHEVIEFVNESRVW